MGDINRITVKNIVIFKGATPEAFEILKAVFENIREITLHAEGSVRDTDGPEITVPLNVKTENDAVHLSVDIPEGRLNSYLVGAAYEILNRNGLEFNVISNISDKNTTIAGILNKKLTA